ncbi:hypothetical protein, partial [Citrobacter youngae]|uniref:hypothetical protein n=1 Tax=Citrobacter youngae TaxID=133448 RepID=UPI003EE297E5
DIPARKVKLLKVLPMKSVSKTGVGATLPGVQIPLSPPLFKHLHALLSTTAVTDVFFFEYPHKFVVLLPS